MADFIDGATAGFAFKGERRQQPRNPREVEFADDLEGHSIPSRGIVVAVLLSGLLWVGIIMGVRALWLHLR